MRASGSRANAARMNCGSSDLVIDHVWVLGHVVVSLMLGPAPAVVSASCCADGTQGAGVSLLQRTSPLAVRTSPPGSRYHQRSWKTTGDAAGASCPGRGARVPTHGSTDGTRHRHLVRNRRRRVHRPDQPCRHGACNPNAAVCSRVTRGRLHKCRPEQAETVAPGRHILSR